MADMPPQVVYLTTKQVAERFHVDASAVRRWIADGRLQPAIRTPGGHYRFDAATIDAAITRLLDDATL